MTEDLIRAAKQRASSWGDAQTAAAIERLEIGRQAFSGPVVYGALALVSPEGATRLGADSRVIPALAAASLAAVATIAALGCVVAFAQNTRGRRPTSGLIGATIVGGLTEVGLLALWPRDGTANGSTLGLAVSTAVIIGLIGWPLVLGGIGFNRRALFLLSVAFAPLTALSMIVLSGLLLHAFS